MFKRLLRNIALLILVIFIIFWIAEAISYRPTVIVNNLVKRGRLNSQVIKLKLTYLTVIPLGVAEIENLGKERFRRQELVHIRAEARTFDYIASIFHAKAVINSYIDPKNFNAVYFLQHMEMINKPDEDKEISYDQKRHLMKYQGPRGQEERVIDNDAQDPLSALYYFQNKPFKVGDEFALSLNTNQKNYVIKAKCIGNETLSSAGRDYVVWIMESSVNRKDKSPRHQSIFKIWFLDNDGLKIPILIKAMTDLGPVMAKAI